MAKSRSSLQPKQRARSSSRYKRSETSRLLKGAMDAGLAVRGFEVDPVTGVLRVLVDKPGEPSSGGNSWDEVLNAKDAQRAS
jgi:hypothetical protein